MIYKIFYQGKSFLKKNLWFKKSFIKEKSF